MAQSSMLPFLKKLAKNNDKGWFEDHRDEYDAARQEFEQLTESVIQETAKFDESIAHYEPKKAMLRIHRDMRFTKNKPPYHTTFRLGLNPVGKQAIAASYYLNYEPGNIFMGGGLVGAPTEAVRKVREEIDHNWKEFQGILHKQDFKSLFNDLQKTEEFSLKRPPKGYAEDNPATGYLKLTDFVARRWLKDETLSQPELVSEIVKSFEAAKPFLDFVNRNLK
ncbi:DUF2461 domain-containing protein [Spirosoma flavum]|uniref:DUF2461 domain-containing protein n=1 Tax=Spirosoma flavum TaxID=2048557 RepID=A0ABW6AI32_9BACT